MTDNPDTRPKEAQILPVADVPHAPFIFFENVPIFGFKNGIVNISLTAMHAWVTASDGVLNEQVVVAHLRGNVQAAISLRHAIDQALLLAAHTGGKAN
jgi:hypothetical protein